jgi:DNA-binding transcriptional ArsR family regulator
MDTGQAIGALGALAQETRLSIFRLLIQSGPEGMSAGAIADALNVPASSLSFHLAQLSHAGLVAPQRRSRQIIYAIAFDTMNALMAYLTENCCQGAASVCSSDDGTGCAPANPTNPSEERAVS